MIHPALPVLLLALAVPVAAAPEGTLDQEQLAQLTIHERIVIRVPRMLGRRAPAPAATAWKEKKGPKCIAIADLGGAMVSQPGSVDLVLTGNRRLRAKFDGDCGPIDFYSGFYLRPAADGQVCAKRDVIRMRSGTSCQIDAFKILRPEP
ncbi:MULTISPECIES: hypothetical protein [unclassified Sphingomonas]|uniref:hypothetical protein n=1 Tax=unclassified Sphingomonas TaxID=196159 RepID=UPI0022698B82|nr:MULTISPECIES: hypothetical protein [unclassified Sphingomonas]